MHSHALTSRRRFLQQALIASASVPIVSDALVASAAPASEATFILGAPLTHSDWMLKPNIAWGTAGVKHMLDACKASGWSKVYWRVADGGRSLYRSKLMRPMGRWDEDSFWSPQSDADKALFKRYVPQYSEDQRKGLLAKFDRLDYASFDSLAEAVRYGHTIGLEIHAWITINEDDHGCGLQSEFTKKHPEFRWVKRSGTRYRSQLSFAFPEVRQYKLALLNELLRNYPIDGLFLDWIRTGDVRDNPQNDASGIADYGYEKPLLDRYKKLFKKDALEVANGTEDWVQLRAAPQTQFMRDARRLLRKHNRKLPLSVMVGHPWHYRGEQNKIDGNLRGLLLDVNAWAREGLIDGAVAAGYYRDGGNAEKAAEALRKETEGKVDIWNFAWVPSSPEDVRQTFDLAERTKATNILFWEADYIDDRGAARESIQTALKSRARR